MKRARTWLIVAAVLVGALGLALAVVGPWVLRRVFQPIAQMKAAQTEFEAWVKARAFREPETPTLDEAKLTSFLALRRELIAWDNKIAGIGSRMPEDRKPSLGEIAGVMEGVGGMVGDHLAAYRRHDITPAEYSYLRRIVYEKWLGALIAAGADPAGRSRAAREIESAAESERSPAVKARLAEVASRLRAGLPAAPEGIPPAVHALLIARAEEIQTLAVEVSGSSGRRSRRSASP